LFVIAPPPGTSFEKNEDDAGRAATNPRVATRSAAPELERDATSETSVTTRRGAKCTQRARARASPDHLGEIAKLIGLAPTILARADHAGWSL